MILFNSSFYNPVSYSSHRNDLYVKSKLTNTVHNIRKNFDLGNSKYNRSYCLIALNSNVVDNSSNFEFSQKNQKNKIIKRNFWQKLVNKYWQETIFISSSNSLLENYTNKLKSTGLSVYEGNDYKNFLLQFSKDLLDRKINFNSNTLNNSQIADLVNKKNIYIKYKWLKCYNPNILFTKYNDLKSQTYNFTNSIDDSLPLFVLMNNNKQIILAESSDQLSDRQMFLKFYHKFTQTSLYTKKLYTGLFFIHPEDAIEYKNYINTHYSKSTRNLQVKLVATTLNFYNQMLSKSNDITEFRLVPDLKEVGNLLYKYQKYKNLKFNVNQKYGANYFQGQPIYIIRTFNIKNDLNIFKYSYSHDDNRKNNQTGKYNAVFLNHETAINAWQAYKKLLNNDHLPKRPDLYVSNLEAFMQTSNYVKNQDKFVLLPSSETFDFIKAYLQNNFKNSSNIWRMLKNNSLHLKSFCYRALWSLTTRQPNIW